jgi:hypothetical protein
MIEILSDELKVLIRNLQRLKIIGLIITNVYSSIIILNIMIVWIRKINVKQANSNNDKRKRKKFINVDGKMNMQISENFKTEAGWKTTKEIKRKRSKIRCQ